MIQALVISSIIFLVACIYIFFKERLALYHPLLIFCLWHFFFYVVVPWQLWYQDDWVGLIHFGVPLDTDEYLVRTFIVVNVGFLATMAGWFSHMGGRWAGRWQKPQLVLQPHVTFLVCLFFLILAAYSVYTYHPIAGLHADTINPMVSDKIGGTIFVEGTAYAYAGYFFLVGTCLLGVYLNPTQKRAWRIFFGLVILCYVLFAIQRGHHRASWALFLLGLLSLWLMQQRRSWPPLWAIAAAIPLVVIFNIGAIDRDAWKKMLTGRADWHTYTEEATERAVYNVKGDMSNFEYNTFLIMLYPDKIPYELGRTYINSWLIHALPRMIFKDKDEYKFQTEIAKTKYIYLTAGPTSGLYVDLYRNFGYSGVTIGCFLFGLIMQFGWQALRQAFQEGPGSQYILLVYAGLLTFFPQLLRDGLGNLVQGYFFILTPILLALWLSKIFSQEVLYVKKGMGIEKKALE